MKQPGLSCQKCGHENPLGCVFCRQCGVKLDLNRLTSRQVEESQRESWFAANRAKLVLVPIALLILGVAMALWPNMQPIGESGTLVGGRRVERRLKTFMDLPRARRLGVDPAFKEADVNGYFRFIVLKRTPGRSFSVDIGASAVRARLIDSLFALRLGGITLIPKASFDVVCVPRGGELVVQSASIGHLPAWGPLGNIAVDRIRSLLASNRELSGLKHVVEITLHDGSAGLVLEP